MRAVLDTNVLVSGIARYADGRSAPARALILGLDGGYRIILSDAILDEARSALLKAYFRARWDHAYLDERLLEIREAAEVVALHGDVRGIASYWHDDVILDTARTGEADFLVTGDHELLTLNHPFGFRIIHPNEFVTILEGDLSSP